MKKCLEASKIVHLGRFVGFKRGHGGFHRYHVWLNTALLHDLVQRDDHPRRRCQCIPPIARRRRAGMGFPAFDRHLIPTHRLDAGDDADAFFLRFEDRPLLDMAFEIRADLAPADGLFALGTDPLQLIAETCAFQVADIQRLGQLHLAGEDGALRIIKVKKRRIELVKQYSKVESQCLSLEFDHIKTRVAKERQVKMKKTTIDSATSESSESDEIDINSPDDDENGRVQSIYCGYQDGSIRKWNLRNGNCTLHIEKDPAKKDEDASLIWCLKLHKDTLISGDSKGHVCLWDTRFGTLLKKFTTLQADILALEVNPRFNCIYASGVDSRVISIHLGGDQGAT